MCGIAFLYGPERLPDARRESMGKALEVMAHRGPDDFGVTITDDCVIGHRRLSIIDLAASKQPMVSPDGRYILSFNGEIYTYLQLREQLEERWNFVTNGDTEVLLAGLILEGTAFLSKLEGMWAFALWDNIEGALLLSRDRMGKKPLFYVTREKEFLCASHLPALKFLDERSWSEDYHSTADFFRYGYCLPGHTAYEQVREVLPGHYLRWSSNESQFTQQPYWTLSPESFKGSMTEGVECLKERIITATDRRLVADVEVGAFLSGGIDSSLVVSLAKKRIGHYLKTFTIGFGDETFDERKYARLVADFMSTDHYEEVFGRLPQGKLDNLILEHLGQPFADPSLLPTTLVSSVASKYVKVALSGDGGDELFSGYQRYQAKMLLRWYTRLPEFFRRNINTTIKALPEPMAHHSRSILKKAHLFADIAERVDSETPYYGPIMMQPELWKKLAPDISDMGHQPPALPEQTSPGDLQRMMLADVSVYLPQDILAKVDRASMAQSLEVRAPFLDREVIELAFSFPVVWHRNIFSGGKKMLRKAFGDLLPSSVWKRRKQGFAVPVHEWFRGELGEKLITMLSGDSGPLDPEVIRRIMHDHDKRRRDHGVRLWMIYVYLLWREKKR